MMTSLRTRLAAAFLAFSLIVLLGVAVAANFLVVRSFRDYAVRGVNARIHDTLTLLPGRFAEGSAPDIAGVSQIGTQALEQGLILRVSSVDGRVLWDAGAYHNGDCTMMLSRMAENMQQMPGFSGQYEERRYRIERDGNLLGYADIGYYGPYYLTDSDILFMQTLNRVLIGTGIAAALLSVLTGLWLAGYIARPLDAAAQVARRISRGDGQARMETRTRTREMAMLAGAINNLAGQLETQELLRRQMTSDVAHELRTPVAALRAQLETMAAGVWKPTPERLGACMEETRRMSRLIDDLSSLARAEAGASVMVRTRTDMDQLVRQAAGAMQAAYMAKGLLLEQTGHGGVLYLESDKVLQILLNLLSNAWKYTPAGGRVEVSLERHEDGVMLRVRDNGIGIPEKDLPHIFERFYRVDSSRTRETGGAGIGLTIARTLAQAHGGSLMAASEEGRGTVMTLWLPGQIA